MNDVEERLKRHFFICIAEGMDIARAARVVDVTVKQARKWTKDPRYQLAVRLSPSDTHD